MGNSVNLCHGKSSVCEKDIQIKDSEISVNKEKNYYLNENSRCGPKIQPLLSTPCSSYTGKGSFNKISSFIKNPLPGIVVIIPKKSPRNEVKENLLWKKKWFIENYLFTYMSKQRKINN